MTSRRGFLAAVAAAFVVDPERLLWVPGKKLISIPKPAGIPMRLMRELDMTTGYYYIKRIDLYGGRLDHSNVLHRVSIAA